MNLDLYKMLCADPNFPSFSLSEYAKSLHEYKFGYSYFMKLSMAGPTSKT